MVRLSLAHYLKDFLRSPADTEDVVRGFCASPAVPSSGELKTVDIDAFPEAQSGRCYWNVQTRMAHGGEMVFGWQVSWLPGYFVQLVHHAVLGQDGILIDVTPSLLNEKHSLFVPFDKKIDFEAGERLPKIVQPLISFQPMMRWIAYDLVIDDLRIQTQAEGASSAVRMLLDNLGPMYVAAQDQMMHAIASREGKCLCGSRKPYSSCHGQSFANEEEALAFIQINRPQ